MPIVRKAKTFQLLDGGYGVLRHFQQYFSYIVAVSFIGGGKPECPEKNTVPIM
jgi:hypothetical protein